MTNNCTLRIYFTIQGHTLVTVYHFKYIGVIICFEGSRREMLSNRAAQQMATLARLNTSWKDNNIIINTHAIRLISALAITIFLYACETWTPTAELQRTIQCFRKILGISYKDRKEITRMYMPWTVSSQMFVTDFLISSVNSCRLCAMACVSAKDLPVHSAMLSVHLLFGMPLLRLPSTVVSLWLGRPIL